MRVNSAGARAAQGEPQDAALRAVLRKITRRLIPFLFVLYVFAYLDRVNVGFAAGSMQRSLGFSNTVYGTGGGIFFLGYALFEVPSNLLLLRVGPRRWIGSLMVVWGLLSAGMLLVRTAPQFYAERLLLGVSEAGFFPGVILYLTFWFPARERARGVARFMTATAVAGLLGSPASSLLLQLEGHAHLLGWQWLFLAEGVPSVLLGLLAMRMLPESPERAQWLTAEERAHLLLALEQDEREDGGAGGQAGHSHTLRAALLHPTVWVLAVVYFCLSFSLYTLSLWLPLLLRGMGAAHGEGAGADWRIGLLSSVPYLAAALTMSAIARRSDRTGERRMHLVVCLMAAAAGYLWSAVSARPVLGLLALCVVAVGTWGAMGPFWALPSSRLRGDARAGGIALINSIGALGGFAGPMLLGVVRDRLHSFSAGLVTAACLLLAGAGVAFFWAVPSRRAETIRD